MDKRLEATITGRVQGVSFRYYTQREAARLQLCGWVANRRDGAVQVIAEGPEPALEVFCQFLSTGSPHAQVAEVQAEWQDAQGNLEGFQIRYL